MRVRSRGFEPLAEHTLASYLWAWRAWREHGFPPLTAWRLACVRWRLLAGRAHSPARAIPGLPVGAGEPPGAPDTVGARGPQPLDRD
ncbi:MAG: hypothetical protein IRZ14_03010 [Chloroflexi bacterium]|nr:hypothetical protein [Chloroflexota bacterium]